MRRQDELMLLFPGQSTLARTFLLAQMEGLSRAFDSDELLEFLQGELAGPDPVLRAQSLVSLARFLPDHVRKRYALSSTAMGPWTSYSAGQPDAKALARDALQNAARAPAVRQAILTATRPLVDAVMSALARLTGWNRTRAVMALGHLPSPESRDWLAQAVSSGEPSLEVGLALAEHVRGEPATTLLDTIRAHGARRPDLLLLLTACPGARAFDLILEMIPRTSTVGRMNLARVMGHAQDGDTLAGFRALRACGEGWVLAEALSSLEMLGDQAFLPAIADVYRTTPSRFLRMQALKAAGGVRHPDAPALCREALAQPDHGLAAVALESLVRLRARPADLRDAAAPFLASPHVKARVNAILASLSSEEALEHPSVRGLLLSRDPLSRLEGAYCLGYAQSPRALELVAMLASSDPVPIVRSQAIKALSKYPARDAVPHLVPLVAAGDQRLALSAARVIARYENDEAGAACQALVPALAAAERPFTKALLYRALGVAGSRSSAHLARDALVAGLDEKDPRALAGVLEAWILVGSGGDAAVDARLALLAGAADGRLRARALLARWHSGDLEAPEALGRMIRSGDEALVDPALECALEIGLVRDEIAGGHRFPELSRALVAPSRPGEPVQPAAFREPPRAAPSLPVEEVDFEVRRPLAVGARRAGLEPGELRRFLDKPSIRNPRAGRGVRQRLEQVSCFVGTDLHSVGERLRALLAQRAVLAGVAAPLVLAALFFALRSAEEPLKPLPFPAGHPGHLWVDLAEGVCESRSRALEARRVIAPGDPVNTLSGSELILKTPQGGRVVLKGESRCTFEAVGSRSSDPVVYRFRDAEGDVKFEFERGPALELVFGRRRIQTRGALVHVARSPPPRTVEIRRGSALMRSPDGDVPLRDGRRITFE